MIYKLWNIGVGLCRTMDWCQSWSRRFCLMGNMGSTGPLKWPRRYGLRFSSTLLRTMSCLKVSFSSPAWLLLGPSARTKPHLNRLPNTPSSSSAEESPQLSLESWYASIRRKSINQLFSLSLSPSYTQRLTQISKSLIFWLSSFYLVGNLRWKLPSTWMQWTKLLTHGTCPSHTQEPFRTLAWRRGEEGLRTWRRLKILFFSGQRPTLLLSLASIPVRESLRSPSKECSWRVMSTKPFNLLHGWTR